MKNRGGIEMKEVLEVFLNDIKENEKKEKEETIEAKKAIQEQLNKEEQEFVIYVDNEMACISGNDLKIQAGLACLIETLRMKGMSIKDIQYAIGLGLENYEIRQISTKEMKKVNLPKKKIYKKDIKRYLKEGKTQKEIADIYGTSQPYISLIKKKWNL